MYERRDFSHGIVTGEVGLHTLILPERMQFVDEEPAAAVKHPSRFRENEREMLDVLQYEIAGN